MGKWIPNKHANYRFRRRHRLYTTREAAVMLRHSVWWVRRMIREGRMSAVKLGSAYYINSMEITRWMGLLPRGRSRVGQVIRAKAREISPARPKVEEAQGGTQVPGLQGRD